MRWLRPPFAASRDPHDRELDSILCGFSLRETAFAFRANKAGMN
jgi:hypothetical protein